MLFASMPTMLQTHIVNQLKSSDYATILAIGWDQIAKCDSNTSRNLVLSLNNNVTKCLEQLTTCKDVQSYYQLVRFHRNIHFHLNYTENYIICPLSD